MDYIQAIRMLNFDWKCERNEKLTAVCVACVRPVCIGSRQMDCVQAAVCMEYTNSVSANNERTQHKARNSCTLSRTEMEKR